jgi:hypothetical protein
MFIKAVATPSAWLYESETFLASLKSWVSRRELESGAQHGSAAKAAIPLERSCPNKSMAPVLAIV